ncbi:MAG: UDP-N-acetylmuramoyl-L-alanyl-D-glutamate--2,6-diaminopimelate ligase [Pirellulales bacterium]
MHDSVLPPCGISLRTLFPEAVIFGADDIVVRSCSADSRAVQPGDLFAAIVGPDCDGHDFIYEAAFRGATAVLAERYVAADGLPVCVVSDTRAAFGRLAHALAGNPSQRLKVIGVTGTAGKTTTVALIDSILTAAGRRVGSTSGLLHFDGTVLEPPSSDTPHACALAAALARMESNGCDCAVIEVSSQALSQLRLAGLTLDLACVTNVRRDHLEYHSTVRNYRDIKARLFQYLRPGGAAVLNLDDAASAEYLRGLDGPALTVAMIANADLTAVVIERFAGEQTFLLSAGSEAVPVRTRVIGDQHVYNCLTAAAVGLLHGVSLTEIARGLERVESIPGRMERLECGQPFGVFVDAAQTPDALGLVLETLREVTERRLICVFGAEGDRDAEPRALAGQTVEAFADIAVVTENNPRGEDSTRIASDILRGFDSRESVVVMHDRAKAICWALAQAQPGDCVLIAGKGFDNLQHLGTQTYWFDDREIACRWLYEQGQQTDFPIHRREAA